ncbi:hypothetical protein B0F90DRAFT_1628378 [Multifurca ochricompacta]|uniref:XRRM domain-containing protein n=1 Tax=Multifurca ochricompacta TaxID=376703 RepID=A0AAD4M4T9_9AGAM|nr:hypothetical protein B0F90DRAFT_1628378 [Multifurca ochricompacta]
MSLSHSHSHSHSIELDQVSTTTLILFHLAFSNYQLWINPTLRDPNKDGCMSFNPSQNLISLRTLLHTSPLFLAANTDILTEASIVKSLRTHARHIFDVRMIIVDKTQPRSGGYELRRKDWVEVTQRFPTFNPEYWDAQTIYIENVPHSFRSTIGISKLLHSLLNNHSSSSLGSYQCIESIFFPPHHQDPPDALPKCKGFALVTLADLSTSSHLLSRFPYKRNNSNSALTGGDTTPEEQEARKAGFRTLSKERWEALQAEYIEYRDSLLRPITDSSYAVPHTIHPPAPTSQHHVKNAHDSDQAEQRGSSCAWSYPRSCVLFVRHVPPDTNKTALRTRFSALLGDSFALDYVDYTKGLDTCYLRLTTREHALSLLKLFKEDAAEMGKKGEEEETRLVLELLEGRREEMYWEQVPEKVRVLAVQHARAVVHETAAAAKGGGGCHHDIGKGKVGVRVGVGVEVGVRDAVEERGDGEEHTSSGTGGRKRRRHRR